MPKFFTTRPVRQWNDLARKCKADYEGGMSIRALAAREGCSFGIMHKTLDEQGVVFRGRGGDMGGAETNRGRSIFSAELQEQICDAYRDGAPMHKLVEVFGPRSSKGNCSISAVQNVLRKHDVPMRPPGKSSVR